MLNQKALIRVAALTVLALAISACGRHHLRRPHLPLAAVSASSTSTSAQA